MSWPYETLLPLGCIDIRQVGEQLDLLCLFRDFISDHELFDDEDRERVDHEIDQLSQRLADIGKNLKLSKPLEYAATFAENVNKRTMILKEVSLNPGLQNYFEQKQSRLSILSQQMLVISLPK